MAYFAFVIIIILSLGSNGNTHNSNDHKVEHNKSHSCKARY